jgi:predicted nucleotidyltransferase
MKYGLSEKQLAEIVERIGTYAEVETAVLFGSRAIDTFKEASDVDIALKGEHVTASLAAKLKYDFEEESYLPFFFDFVAYPTITNEALRRHIDDKGIVIFRREWRECKLGDAPLEILDGDRGKNYPSQDEFKTSGHCLFLSTKNVRVDGFDFSDCQYISKERDELLRKGKLKRNDIVLTTRGTVGNIGFFDDSVQFENIRINSGMVIIRPNEAELLPSFNYYVLI